MSSKPFSLYIHIPFCLHKCPYCDFNTYAVSTVPEKEYSAALLAELDYRATLPEWRGRTVQTIYFGGGTPSLFSGASIRKIISVVCSLFPVDELAEISLEANPGTIEEHSLNELREAGVNRLSIGSQSFEPRLLQALGRIHTVEQTEAAVHAAKNAGFNNINLDLMYGIAGQHLTDLRRDLHELIGLNPTHISAYNLTIEKGTPFYIAYRKRKLKLPKEDLVVEMMQELNGFLPGAGYERYEISNFSQPGKEARHNMAYWNGDDYLGLGAGAHSFNVAGFGQNWGVRWSSFALPSKYMKETVAHGLAESWRETLAVDDAVFEFFFLGLRKVAGVNWKQFRERFEVDIDAVYPTLLEVLKTEQLIVVEGEFLRLTDKGLLFADSVIENFAKPNVKVLPERMVNPTQVAAAA